MPEITEFPEIVYFRFKIKINIKNPLEITESTEIVYFRLKPVLTAGIRIDSKQTPIH